MKEHAIIERLTPGKLVCKNAAEERGNDEGDAHTRTNHGCVFRSLVHRHDARYDLEALD